MWFMLNIDAGCEFVYDSLLAWKAFTAVVGWFMKNPDKVGKIDTSKLATDISQILESLNIGKGRNIAFADININGVKERLIGVSGQAIRDGTVGNPINRLFTTSEVGGFSRAFDSEVKILEQIAQSLDKNATGIIKLYSERDFCNSCQSVIAQFQKMFPNIQLIIEAGE